MPEISRFFGIVIKMYFQDHNPPHFHAEYGDEKAEYDIQTLSVLAGKLSKRAHAMVLEWAVEHRDELIQDWELARKPEQLKPIKPLQ